MIKRIIFFVVGAVVTAFGIYAMTEGLSGLGFSSYLAGMIIIAYSHSLK